MTNRLVEAGVVFVVSVSLIAGCASPPEPTVIPNLPVEAAMLAGLEPAIPLSEIVPGQLIAEVYPELTAEQTLISSFGQIMFGTDPRLGPDYYTVSPESLEKIFKALESLAEQGFILEGADGQMMVVGDTSNLDFLVALKTTESGGVLTANLPAGSKVIASNDAMAIIYQFNAHYAEILSHNLLTRYGVRKNWGPDTPGFARYATGLGNILETKYQETLTALQEIRRTNPPVGSPEFQQMAELEEALKFQHEALIDAQWTYLQNAPEFDAHLAALNHERLIQAETFCFQYNPEAWWKLYKEKQLSQNSALQHIKSLEQAIAFSEQINTLMLELAPLTQKGQIAHLADVFATQNEPLANFGMHKLIQQADSFEALNQLIHDLGGPLTSYEGYKTFRVQKWTDLRRCEFLYNFWQSSRQQTFYINKQQWLRYMFSDLLGKERDALLTGADDFIASLSTNIEVYNSPAEALPHVRRATVAFLENEGLVPAFTYPGGISGLEAFEGMSVAEIQIALREIDPLIRSLSDQAEVEALLAQRMAGTEALFHIDFGIWFDWIKAESWFWQTNSDQLQDELYVLGQEMYDAGATMTDVLAVFASEAKAEIADPAFNVLNAFGSIEGTISVDLAGISEAAAIELGAGTHFIDIINPDTGEVTQVQVEVIIPEEAAQTTVTIPRFVSSRVFQQLKLWGGYVFQIVVGVQVGVEAADKWGIWPADVEIQEHTGMLGNINTPFDLSPADAFWLMRMFEESEDPIDRERAVCFQRYATPLPGGPGSPEAQALVYATGRWFREFEGVKPGPEQMLLVLQRRNGLEGSGLLGLVGKPFSDGDYGEYTFYTLSLGPARDNMPFSVVDPEVEQTIMSNLAITELGEIDEVLVNLTNLDQLTQIQQLVDEGKIFLTARTGAYGRFYIMVGFRQVHQANPYKATTQYRQLGIWEQDTEGKIIPHSLWFMPVTTGGQDFIVAGMD